MYIGFQDDGQGLCSLGSNRLDSPNSCRHGGLVILNKPIRFVSRNVASRTIRDCTLGSKVIIRHDRYISPLNNIIAPAALASSMGTCVSSRWMFARIFWLTICSDPLDLGFCLTF